MRPNPLSVYELRVQDLRAYYDGEEDEKTRHWEENRDKVEGRVSSEVVRQMFATEQSVNT